MLEYWPLMIVALIGGQLGNYINVKLLKARTLALITACLVLFVALRMGIKIFLS